MAEKRMVPMIIMQRLLRRKWDRRRGRVINADERKSFRRDITGEEQKNAVTRVIGLLGSKTSDIYNHLYDRRTILKLAWGMAQQQPTVYADQYSKFQTAWKNSNDHIEDLNSRIRQQTTIIRARQVAEQAQVNMHRQLSSLTMEPPGNTELEQQSCYTVLSQMQLTSYINEVSIILQNYVSVLEEDEIKTTRADILTRVPQRLQEAMSTSLERLYRMSDVPTAIKLDTLRFVNKVPTEAVDTWYRIQRQLSNLTAARLYSISKTQSWGRLDGTAPEPAGFTDQQRESGLEDACINKDLFDTYNIRNHPIIRQLEAYVFPNGLNLRLSAHQCAIIHALTYCQSHLLVSLHLGAGKTLAALAAAIYCMNSQADDETRINSKGESVPTKWQIIMVGPTAAQSVFKNDTQRYFGFLPSSKRRLYTVGFKALLNMLKDKDNGRISILRKHRLKRTILIVDEAHHLNTKITKKQGMLAQGMMQFARKVPYVLLLSATPVKHNLSEFNNMFSILQQRRKRVTPVRFRELLSNGNFVGDMLGRCIFLSRSEYDPRYPRVQRFVRHITMPDPMYIKYMQYENKIDLEPDESDGTRATNAAMLGDIMHMMEDMPEEQRDDIQTEEDLIRAMKQHGLPVVGLSQFLTRFGKSPRKFLGGIRRASASLEGKPDTVNPKFEEALKIAIEENPGKSVIFTPWLQCGVHVMHEILKTKKDREGKPIQYFIYSGKQTVEERELIQQYFSDEITRDTVAILLVTTAGGEALNIVQAKNIILCEPTWSSLSDEQIVGRVVRRGSHISLPVEEQKVNVYQLLLSKPARARLDNWPLSADEQIYQLQQSKLIQTNQGEAWMRQVTSVAYGSLIDYYVKQQQEDNSPFIPQLQPDQVSLPLPR